MQINSSIKTEIIDNMPDTLTFKSSADNHEAFAEGSQKINCSCTTTVPYGYTKAIFSCAAGDARQINRFYCTNNGTTIYDGQDISNKSCNVSEGDQLYCYLWESTNSATDVRIVITLSKN